MRVALMSRERSEPQAEEQRQNTISVGDQYPLAYQLECVSDFLPYDHIGAYFRGLLPVTPTAKTNASPR